MTNPPVSHQLVVKKTTIAIVAGELSGDTLGAGLIQALKEIRPDLQFVGIGGPKMIEQGCHSLYDIQTLSVMGLVEVMSRLGSILKVKHGLTNYFKLNPPDLFIGIDSPDFNLPIEKQLKSKGIKTVHYVSPSVWAWRPKRIKTIAEATDLVLSILPFEKSFYDKHHVPCTFVGHTLADNIPLMNDQRSAQYRLHLDPSKRWIALLPGSRLSEIEKMSEPFLKTCLQLAERSPHYRFIVPLANQSVRKKFEEIKAKIAPDLSILLIDASSTAHSLVREVVTAADVALVTSGTATLECLLVKRPMVVAYKANGLTYFIGEKLFQLDHFSLPNIIAGKELVPEFLQAKCHETFLAPALIKLLEQDNQSLLEQFCQIHLSMRCQADREAAKAILQLMDL